MIQEELIQYWLDSSEQDYRSIVNMFDNKKYVWSSKKYPDDQRNQNMASGKNTDIIHEELKRYISLLRDENISVIQAYLFGSYAKNSADEWSDIDVAVVTDRFVGDRFDFRFLLTRLARKIDADIEPHPYLISEFGSENPIAAEIMRTGNRIV